MSLEISPEDAWNILTKLPLELQIIIYNFYVVKRHSNNVDILKKIHYKRFQYVLEEMMDKFHPMILRNIFLTNMSYYPQEEAEKPSEVLSKSENREKELRRNRKNERKYRLEKKDSYRHKATKGRKRNNIMKDLKYL